MSEVKHEIVGTHSHPMVTGVKPKNVLHMDCRCGAVCYEPHVFAWHVTEAVSNRRAK